MVSNGLPEGEVGQCDPINKIIMIDGELSDDETKITAIHEIGHAVWAEAGYENLDVSGEAQEMIVDGIARAIARNFNLTNKKNP